MERVIYSKDDFRRAILKGVVVVSGSIFRGEAEEVMESEFDKGEPEEYYDRYGFISYKDMLYL